MSAPDFVALVYFAYLAVAGTGAREGPRRRRERRGESARRRRVGWRSPTLATTIWSRYGVRIVWPLALLFAGYRLAGWFYEQANEPLERWLLELDGRIEDWVRRTAGERPGTRVSAPRGPWLRSTHWLEAAYLSVYVVIPLGALVVAATATGAGRRSVLDRRARGRVRLLRSVAVDSDASARAHSLLIAPPVAVAGLRRVNLAILERGSIGVNTLPSGHAATAVATAVAVAPHAPVAAAALGLAALLIASPR